MKKKEQKTNVMRLLDQARIRYESHFYDVDDGAIDGVSVAKKIGEDVKQVYKTLVCQSAGKTHYVFVIPVENELDLKKAAKAAEEKSIAMLPQKALLPTTGYIHGGCSPIGMKKAFATFIDESGKGLEIMYVSAGKVGAQVGLNPVDLVNMIGAQFRPLTK